MLAAGHASRGCRSRQDRPQLLRPPVRMPAPQRQDRVADRVGHRPSVRLRRPRAIGQPRRRIRVVAIHPLVGGLSTDLIALRQLRHRPLVSQPLRNKRHALIHGARLRPRHSSSLADCPSNLSPMYPVYSVTYVSGSDPPSPQPPAPTPGLARPCLIRFTAFSLLQSCRRADPGKSPGTVVNFTLTHREQPPLHRGRGVGRSAPWLLSVVQDVSPSAVPSASRESS